MSSPCCNNPTPSVGPISTPDYICCANCGCGVSQGVTPGYQGKCEPGETQKNLSLDESRLVVCRPDRIPVICRPQSCGTPSNCGNGGCQL